ncbi:MAG: ArsR/SmtB family transcription factor [Candidatus Bathyarchaeia archaeon]
MKPCSNETCHKFFLALANPTRLAILEILQDGPKNVAEISEKLHREQSMISHNLKPLEDCVFIFSERRGRERVYRVNNEIIAPLFELFCFHANKYCPNGRVCLTENGLERFKKQEAAKPLFLNQK